MINSTKLEYKDLKLVRKGLKKCIKEAKKLAEQGVEFQMQIYSHCALGRIAGITFYPSWKSSFIELFQFMPHTTNISVSDDDRLHPIYKKVNRLFVSGVFPKEKVSAKNWRKEAKIVLMDIEEQIAKFN